MAQRSPTRSAVIALMTGVALLLLALTLGVRARLLVVLGLLVLAPGLWWRWKTRRFRQGVRALRRGEREAAAERFREFLEQIETDDGFLRYQPFFNLGRPYDYVAAGHNNLGALALQAGDRAGARRELEAAVARPGAFAPAYYGRAALSLLEGDLEMAERTARAGLEADPRYRPCGILLALCLAERGERAGAETTLASLKKPLSWDEARSLWAGMYRLWGESERAAKWKEL